MTILWDKSRWEQTYGFRLTGNVAIEGYAEPWGACTLDATTNTIAKAAHGYGVDDMVYFQGLPSDSGLCEGNDCPMIVVNPTVDSFQVAWNDGRYIAVDIAASGPAEVAKSRKGEWLTYSSEMFSRDNRHLQFYLRRDRIMAAFPEMQTSDRILIVGASHLGLEVKAFRDGGFTNCWGTDLLDWDGDGDTPPDGIVVIQGNIAAPAIRPRLRSATGDDIFDWVIDSDVLTSADNDAQAQQWAVIGGEEILGNVSDPTVANEKWRIIHLCTINAPPPFLSNTLLQWQALAPAHSWADPDAKTILRGT